MLCLKLGSPGINLFTSFTPKIQGWSSVDSSSLSHLRVDSWFIGFYDWDGALVSKIGQRNVFRPKQNLEQWLYMR